MTEQITATISKEQARQLLIYRYEDEIPEIELAYLIDNLFFTQFPAVYSNTAGPLGGIGGQAITTFILQAWMNENGFGVIFYNDKILKISDRIRLDLHIDNLPFPTH